MHLVLSRVAPRDLDAIAALYFKAFDGFDLATVFFGAKSPSSHAYLKRKLLEGMRTDPADVLLKIEDLDAEEVDVELLDERGHLAGVEKRTRIVCVSNWKVYPTYVPPKEDGEQRQESTSKSSNGVVVNNGVIPNGDASSTSPPPATPSTDDNQPEIPFSYLPTAQERADAAVLMTDFLSRRRRGTQYAHILCFLLFTDPEYHGRGAGRMMMEWGNRAADALMLPIWIEATAPGEILYRKMGFEVLERVLVQTPSFESRYACMRRPRMVGCVSVRGGEKGR